MVIGQRRGQRLVHLARAARERLAAHALDDIDGLGQTNVSFHLRVLREAGFVRAERRGPFIYYCLADPELLRILHDLKQWLDTRQMPGAGQANPPSRPAKRHSVGARTREAP